MNQNTRTRSLLPFARACAIAALVFGARTAAAQRNSNELPITIAVGSELDSYLRYLQLVDSTVPLHQWSIRDFSPGELRQLSPVSSAHPWADWMNARPVLYDRGRARVELTPAQAHVWYNSSFPFGTNDGPVWRGRGVTVAVQGGFAARYGPVSLSIAPVLFDAQNEPFQLMPNGSTTASVYADPARPIDIDRPQRFGNHSYGRLDPGASTLRVDAGPIALGVSTANMWWGPMTEYPYLLGDNAAGFEHVFIGSETPWNVGIGRLHARLIYGYLDQSAFAIDTGLASRRFASGLAAVFTPRGVPGLELGGARFFHTPNRAGGPTWRDLRKPIEPFLKTQIRSGGDTPAGDVGTDRDNELASVFFRWVLPHSGFETYGEYGREDHAGRGRDLVLEPDHSASYGLGFIKTWRRSADFLALRGELMNIDPSLLQLVRPQGATYTHTYMRQGHTQRGQLLGAGFGDMWGSGSVLSLERYDHNGSANVSLTRMVVRERNGQSGVPSPTVADQDVQYIAAIGTTRHRGRLEIGWDVAAIYELNRNLAMRDARALNLGAHLGWW